MLKENLKSGMRVRTRGNDIYLVVRDVLIRGEKDILFAGEDGGWMNGNSYDDNLICIDRYYDIVEVYTIDERQDAFQYDFMNLKERHSIWKRKEELIPCPFCGTTESLIVGTDEEIGLSEEGKGSGYYQVCCCFTKGGCGSASGFREVKEEAIKLWNTRK